MRAALAVVVVVSALLGAACGSSTAPSTTTTTTTSPVTETFASVVTPKGAAFHTFVMTSPGTVTVTLQSSSNVVVGFGVGVPSPGGGYCNFTASINAAGSATTQIVLSAEAGNYCTGVYDLGTITADAVGVSIKIVHP